jgi:hypothetical protein
MLVSCLFSSVAPRKSHRLPCHHSRHPSISIQNLKTPRHNRPTRWREAASQPYSSITGTTFQTFAPAELLPTLWLVFYFRQPHSGILFLRHPQRTSAIRPLLSLLSPSEDDSISDQPRDLLPTFEALLALTNLASTKTPSRRHHHPLAWPTIEDLLLSNNTLIQRASIELVCNLMLPSASLSLQTALSAPDNAYTFCWLWRTLKILLRGAAGGAGDADGV